MKEENLIISLTYDITYLKRMGKQHLTTVRGKDLSISRTDVLKIVKAQTIEPSIFVKIIDNCIEVVKCFE